MSSPYDRVFLVSGAWSLGPLAPILAPPGRHPTQRGLQVPPGGCSARTMLVTNLKFQRGRGLCRGLGWGGAARTLGRLGVVILVRECVGSTPVWGDCKGEFHTVL